MQHSSDTEAVTELATLPPLCSGPAGRVPGLMAPRGRPPPLIRQQPVFPCTPSRPTKGALWTDRPRKPPARTNLRACFPGLHGWAPQGHSTQPAEPVG